LEVPIVSRSRLFRIDLLRKHAGDVRIPVLHTTGHGRGSGCARTEMKRLSNMLFPDLGSLAEREHMPALRNARKTPFDSIELLGIAGSLVLVTWLSRQVVAMLGAVDRLSIAALSFLVALPLLVVTVGPFMVRRVRRGLRLRLEQRKLGS
jgi:hypothetical protein